MLAVAHSFREIVMVWFESLVTGERVLMEFSEFVQHGVSCKLGSKGEHGWWKMIFFLNIGKDNFGKRPKGSLVI